MLKRQRALAGYNAGGFCVADVDGTVSIMRTMFLHRAAAVRNALRVAASLLLILISLSFARADGIAPVAQFETMKLNVPSRNFGSLIPTVVFVPRGTPPSAGWPVVLLLHGLGGTEVDWTALGEADATYRKLLSSKAVRPAVIIMPGMGSNWYVDSLETGGVKAESAVIADLIPYLRETLHLSKDAQDTSIIGNSMGGYGALRLALKYPEMFGRVALLSPAIWQNVPTHEMNLPPEKINLLIESTYFHTGDDGSVTAGVALPNPGPHFNRAFGEPFDPRRFNALNPFTLLEKRLADGSPLPLIYATVGGDDSHLLWRGALALFETMKAAHRPIAFHMTDGDHTWDVWRAALPDALKFAMPVK
jgi:enterochelin esterase-like enzyme